MRALWTERIRECKAHNTTPNGGETRRAGSSSSRELCAYGDALNEVGDDVNDVRDAEIVSSFAKGVWGLQFKH